MPGGFDLARNLRIRWLNAEFLCLMLHHQPIPNELFKRPILILRHPAQVLQQTKLSQGKRKLETFDLAFDIGLRKCAAVNSGDPIGIRVRRSSQDYKAR